MQCMHPAMQIGLRTTVITKLVHTLYRLRHAPQKFKGVVISNDLTRAERNARKIKVDDRSPSYGAGRYVGGILVPGERQSRAAPDCKNKKKEL